jgi:hypothetical protein
MFIGGWDFCEASLDGNLWKQSYAKDWSSTVVHNTKGNEITNTFHLENEFQ